MSTILQCGFSKFNEAKYKQTYDAYRIYVAECRYSVDESHHACAAQRHADNKGNPCVLLFAEGLESKATEVLVK